MQYLQGNVTLYKVTTLQEGLTGQQKKRKAEQRTNIVQDKDSASEMAIKDSDVEQVDRLYTLTP